MSYYLVKYISNLMIDRIKISNLIEVITLEKIIYINSLAKSFFDIKFLYQKGKVLIPHENRILEIINFN